MEIKEFVLGLQHIGLPAKSIEETIRFYGELGFEVAWQTENGKCAFLKLQNIVIETYEVGEHAAQCYGAIDHMPSMSAMWTGYMRWLRRKRISRSQQWFGDSLFGRMV